MISKENLQSRYDYFQRLETKELEFNKQAIEVEYDKSRDNQTVFIKALSIIGGIFASILFIVALFFTGVFDSNFGMLTFACIFIACSIVLQKMFDKPVVDTISVSAFILGCVLMGWGLYDYLHPNALCLFFILIGFSTIFIVQGYILTFISVLMINASFMTLILYNHQNNYVYIYFSLIAVNISFFFMQEAAIVSRFRRFVKIYNPIKTGLVFSFLFDLAFLTSYTVVYVSPVYFWITSGVLILLIVYLMSKVLKVLDIINTRERRIYYLLTIIVLMPLPFSPYILGALLIVLLSFLVDYKTGFVTGVVAFIFFVSKFYYDLNFTLLTKSILLFSTGVLFISVYLLTNKKLSANEKV